MVKLEKHNLHWKEGFSYEFKKKRKYFDELVKFSKKKQIIALTGLRRVGKTVLLKQLINALIETQRVKRKHILYFSFDEERPSIDGIFQEYAELTGANIEKEKMYVFFDEIQKLQQWQEQIKVYYDNYSNLKFFVSGSESLFIRKKSRESLAGRIFTLEIPILQFDEFLLFRGKEQLVNEPKMFQEEIRKELVVYAKRHFIEIIDEDEETSRFYIESILNKIVYEDIPLLFPIENAEKLKVIVLAIAAQPGMILHYENLARDLAISSKTLEKYIFYLVQANLVKKVYNFSRNFLTSEKKMKKVYLTAPCFCFLHDAPDISKIAENLVALDPEIAFFWRDPFKHEVDFVMKGSEPYPLEVKYRKKLIPQKVKNVFLFLQKFKLKKGVVITEEYEAKQKLKGKTIHYVPLWKWLLVKK